LYFAHDDAKDQEKPFIVELAWCGSASKNKFVMVPEAVRNDAVKGAEAALAARDSGDDDDDDMDK
jgi:hypothetical protein